METWNVPVDLIPPSMIIEFLTGLNGLKVTKDRIELVLEAGALLNRLSPYRLTLCIETDGTFYVILDPPGHTA